MKILILPDNQYQTESKDSPVIGRYYTLEDAQTGTQAQNKAFHALLFAWYKWLEKTDSFVFQDGNKIYDLSSPDADSFRDLIKYRYGEGFDHLQYVDESFCMVKVKTYEEIPMYVLSDFNAGNRGRIKGALKSWTDYSLHQRKNCIDNVIRLIALSQCDDKKVQEILDGMG